MPMPAEPFAPSKDSQARVIQYLVEVAARQQVAYNMRDRLEQVDRAYMREVDFSLEQYKAKLANRKGDTTKFQNVVIPVVMPQVETAVTFQSDMFLTGYPIFGVTSSPQYVDEALQMDTIIGNQQIEGGWIQEYQKAFRNGFKHNILLMEVDWKQIKSWAVETATGTSSSKVNTEVIWEGNSVKNLDLYNCLFDTNVKPSELSTEGDYAGYMKLYSRNGLKALLNSLTNPINEKEALTSGAVIATEASSTVPGTYYFPQINPEALVLPETLGTSNWSVFWTGDQGAGNIGQYLRYNRYQVTTLYCRICPADFKIYNVPSPTVPQVWKFIIVNNQVVVYAERMTNAHQYLPILAAQPYDDGLGYQTKSLAVNVGPIQEITTSLANSSIASRRRAISDRALFNPTMISAAAINNDSPTAKIPVKPSAFGDELAKAYYAIPFRDDQFQINTAEMQGYLGMANLITGSNQARAGQFVKGNKTRAEYNDIQSNAGGRDRSVSMSLEATLMTPTKKIIKANILQYQGGVSLYNPEQRAVIQVDPVALRKAMFEFKLSDGLLPSDKIIDGEALTMALQTIQAVPQLAGGYNVVPMFSYLLKSRGARLQPFEKSSQQLAFEQAMGQWQQAAQMIAEALSKIKMDPSNPEQSQQLMQQLIKQLPPQPTPQQFGYNPQQQVNATPQQTILQQMTQQAASTAAPANNQTTATNVS